MSGRFIGEVEPIYGRWSWPFKIMEVGDWFTVRHEARDPERLRNTAYVRASQLGIKVSVERNYEPGVAKVTRVGEVTLLDVMS